MSRVKTIIGVTVFCIIIISLSSLFNNNFTSLFNQYRPVLLTGGGDQCLSSLNKAGVTFKSFGDQGSEMCPIKNAVRVEGFSYTSPSSSFILSCPTALQLAKWLKTAKIKSFVHAGTINCRKMRGSDFLSEHSFGTAIDISQLDGADIRTYWRSNSQRGQRLAEAAITACKYFSNVLTPDTDKAHHDHFHLDTGLGVGCMSKKW